MGHLIRLGHRRIAHIAGFMEVSRSIERLEGYREAMDSFNLDPLVSLTPAAGLDEAAGEMGLKNLFKCTAKPTLSLPPTTSLLWALSLMRGRWALKCREIYR